ncbi:MAG: ribonuclease HI [Myxococcota bacterium]
MSDDDIELLLAIIVFTDGAASGNPGPGGWASIIRTPEGQVCELGGGAKETTNNRMELLATIKALDHLSNTEGQVVIFSDSTYVIRGITQWIWGWRKKGWKTSTGSEVTNRDLWEWLFRLTYARKPKVSWRYVRGHAGIPGNERCDTIAVSYTKGRRPHLYEGPESNYTVDLTLLPTDTALPKRSSKKAGKKKAHSYLSLVNGELGRHTSWAECERRVKGRSGARFKKAMSADDERTIVRDWGLPESVLAKPSA